MTSADPAGGPPRPAAPPPPPPPPSPPAADPHPDVPPAGAGQPVIGVDLRVSRRLLWVGEAYYPLPNIARVHTLTIHPRRKDAVVVFLRRLLIITAVTTLLFLLAATMDLSGSTSGLSALVVIIAVATLLYSVVDLLKVLGAASHFVLSIETSGPSTAVVTSPDRQQLRQLALRIADAIENPEAEFHVRVDTITISPRHYYFGDNVNMYGGTGNTGMAS